MDEKVAQLVVRIPQQIRLRDMLSQCSIFTSVMHYITHIPSLRDSLRDNEDSQCPYWNHIQSVRDIGDPDNSEYVS